MKHAHDVRVFKNVRIPMYDGTKLGADIYVPDEKPGPLPVVLEYIPYRKDEVALGSSFYSYFPRHGYVIARVDVRGTGASEGATTDEYMPEEVRDGHDVVEWLAAQPFCDGHVNQLGMSYGGFTSLQVAASRPPHLTSIITWNCSDDRYLDDCHYRGGHLRQYYDLAYYASRMIVDNVLPPYPESSEEQWAELWEEHIARNEPYLLEWLEHQTDGPYWRAASVRERTDRIACPVFLIDGWRDGYVNVPFRLYEALQVPKKLLIGPWNHNNPDSAVPGPRIDYLREVIRWLDHWCKGTDTGIMGEAPVVVYVQRAERSDPRRLDSAGAWRAEVAWPAPGADEHVLHLTGGNGLAADAPREDGSDSFEYVPTVGLAGGLWSGGLEFGLPGDQRQDEALSLVYSSAPLEGDITIVGRPRAVLDVSSSASVIGFAISLSDVAPDGTSCLVAKGMLNATRRDSFTDPEPLVPGEIVTLEVEIDATAWRFERGHRIRIAIANADWPNVWPTPEAAISTVYRGPAHASRIILPAVPAEGSAAVPAFADSRSAAEAAADAIAPSVWDITTDLLTGRVSVRISGAWTSRVNPTTVAGRTYSLVTTCDPADPASTSARGQYTRTIARPNSTVVGTSDVLIQATRGHFHVSIDLDLQVNGRVRHSHSWVRTIPRVLL